MDIQPECLPSFSLPRALSRRHVGTAVILLLRSIIMLKLSFPITTMSCLSGKHYSLKCVCCAQRNAQAPCHGTGWVEP